MAPRAQDAYRVWACNVVASVGEERWMAEVHQDNEHPSRRNRLEKRGGQQLAPRIERPPRPSKPPPTPPVADNKK
jgi:hypothetical protein